MFVLKAESLKIQSANQPTIEYLGKVFGQVQSFPLGERPKAEAHCHETSQDGKLSLLVEFVDTLVLFCEGIEPKLSATDSPSAKPANFQPQVNHNPAVAVPTAMVASAPVQTAAAPKAIPEPRHVETMYRGNVIRKPVKTQGSGKPVQAPPSSNPEEAPEQEYVEIMYRGSIIRKPVNSQNSKQGSSKTRSYRGASY